jgi:hypothetical protein
LDGDALSATTQHLLDAAASAERGASAFVDKLLMGTVTARPEHLSGAVRTVLIQRQTDGLHAVAAHLPFVRVEEYFPDVPVTLYSDIEPQHPMLLLCSLDQQRSRRSVGHRFLLDENGHIVHVWWTGNTGSVTRLDTGALQIQLGIVAVGVPALVHISATCKQLLESINGVDEGTQAHISGALRLSTQIAELAVK